MVTPHQGSRRDPAERSRWDKETQGSGRSFHRQMETEGSGLCGDAAMQEKGVSKMLMINMNEMARELKIE